MSETIKGLTELLPSCDIELRIGTIKANTGFSLLAYKTARADTKRLNNICGMLWKPRFFYDEKHILCCGISIYDKEIKEWIERIDVGTESATEKEKGSYSDARKRAGFAWGIGIELYDYPFIWIQWNEKMGWNKRRDKSYPSCEYNIKSWTVHYVNDKDATKGIEIKNEKGATVWKSHEKITVGKQENYGNENIENNDDEKWEIVRTKLIGRGKNEDKTWAELAGKSLTYYVDKKQEFYSEWYATRAQKEIDWRTGMQGEDDSDSKPDPLKNIRQDIQATADDILKTKYPKQIQYDAYTKIIKEAKTEAILITIAARIKTIDILADSFTNGHIKDADEYINILTKISIADNGELDKIASKIHSYKAGGDQNLREHYWNDIEETQKELGYMDNPSLATNSMKKHLKTDDMYTITDWHILKEYHEYLLKKLKKQKDKPKKVEEQTTILEPNEEKVEEETKTTDKTNTEPVVIG